jgi:beta-phosphoglucomutase
MLKAILFDMDGVLVDSEKIIAQAAVELFALRGAQVDTADFTPFIGTGENRFLAGVSEKYRITMEPGDKELLYQIYNKLVPANLQPVSGVHQFVDFCKEKGIKMAIATSADRVKVDINLSAVKLDEKKFDTIITGQDVERKKPFPDIYLVAASELGVSPKECLVIEDAVNGVEAGLAAGCHCLGLTTTFDAAKLHRAHWIAADLASIPDEALAW